jgi:hypothetical protein
MELKGQYDATGLLAPGQNRGATEYEARQAPRSVGMLQSTGKSLARTRIPAPGRPARS